jgi:hypothetical protein
MDFELEAFYSFLFANRQIRMIITSKEIPFIVGHIPKVMEH